MAELLTPAQLAERLQVKKSWVYEQTRTRGSVRDPDPLPHIRLGKYRRFVWDDVWAWVQRRNTAQKR
jgi:hypothetical protein